MIFFYINLDLSYFANRYRYVQYIYLKKMKMLLPEYIYVYNVCTMQGDQLYMDVCFCYLVKSGLSSVRM